MPADFSEVIGRVRINESRIANLRERLSVTDTNTISEFKKNSADLRDFNLEMKEIKTDLFHLKETLREMIKEMNAFARSQDVKVLEKYINMWNPLNFITEKEVLKLIKENAKKPSKSTR
jgi:cob(I)alamin adenosyltransferase